MAVLSASPEKNHTVQCYIIFIKKISEFVMTNPTLTVEQALQQAVNHHRAGQLQDAENLYRAILKAQPNHPDANHNLGVLAVGVGQPAAALPFLKTALKANQGQAQYWLSLIDALIKAGQSDTARQAINAARQRGLSGTPINDLENRLGALVQTQPAAPTKNPVHALAEEHREAGRYREAAVELHNWLELHPQDAGALALLAHVLLLDNQTDAAADALDRARSLSPTLPAVLRNQIRLLLKRQQVEAALQTAQAVHHAEPDDPESWLLLAAALGANKQDAEALSLIERVLQARPHYAEAYANRALVRLRAKDTSAALADAEKALTIKPHLTQLWALTSQLRRQCKNLPGAIEALQKALEQAPDNVDYMIDLGELLRQNDHQTAAIDILIKATAKAPENAKAWANLGTALHSAGKLEKAREAYEVALKIKPDMPEVANNMGAFARNSESWMAALEHFNRALEFSPEHTELLANKGIALLKLKRSPQEIQAIAQKILAIDPKAESAFKLLGELSKAVGSFNEAVRWFKLGLEFSPKSYVLNSLLGGLLKDINQFSEAEAYLRRSMAIRPDNHEILSNLLFTLNYTAFEPRPQLFDEAVRFGELLRQKVGVAHSNWRCAGHPQRLRLGLVSGDLRNHPVGYFLESLLGQIDPEKLEVIAYPTFVERDATTDRLERLVSAWKPLYGKSDAAAVEQIMTDGIHVLLDLSGHTGHNRLPVFASKPAPVQASWLGYFATTGVKEMDYFIGDPYVTPLDEESHFSEKIWRLPESYLCFTPPSVAPDINPLPALSKGAVTFACFNNLAKMNDAVVELWAKVLQAVPESNLFLKTQQLADAKECVRTKERFASHGIDGQRLILEGPSSRAELLAAYQRADVALDPFPYPGGTTSAEALWMGVPVLTLRGNRFLSHVGESIAHNAGLPGWVAVDYEDYVAKAVEHTANLHELVALRAGMRARLMNTPLFDAKRFARNFENMVWAMWNSRTHIKT